MPIFLLKYILIVNGLKEDESKYNKELCELKGNHMSILNKLIQNINYKQNDISEKINVKLKYPPKNSNGKVTKQGKQELELLFKEEEHLEYSKKLIEEFFENDSQA